MELCLDSGAMQAHFLAQRIINPEKPAAHQAVQIFDENFMHTQ